MNQAINQAMEGYTPTPIQSTPKKILTPVGHESGLTLWEINGQIVDAMESLIDPETGEIRDDADIEADLSALQMSRDDKLLNCIRYYKNQMANEKALKDAEDGIKARRTAFGKRAKTMLSYIGSQTTREKDAGLGCDAGVLKFTKSTKVIVDDDKKLPTGTFAFERKPDAKEIKKRITAEKAEYDALETEEEKKTFVSKFAGAAHLETNHSLSIK